MMEQTQRTLQSHPRKPPVPFEELMNLIRSASDCSLSCTACADACLAEPNVEKMRRCIRLDLDCADITRVTAQMLARLTEPDPNLCRQQLETCATSCRLCAEECDKFESEHARSCAESCRRCEEDCKTILQQLGT